jgi:ribosome-associated protein
VKSTKATGTKRLSSPKKARRAPKAPAHRLAPRRALEPPARPRAPDARQLQESRAAAVAALDAALDKKALLPVLLDVSERATYTDFIGIVSGRSDRQVEAISENVVTAMKDLGFPLLGREGSGNGRWTLLDFGDVVLHVFYHPVREVYDLESLWIDAPRVKLAVPPEAEHFQADALYETP